MSEQSAPVWISITSNGSLVATTTPLEGATEYLHADKAAEQLAATEAEYRLIGARAGTVSVMAAIKIEIGRLRYHPINPRHTRRVAAREASIAPLEAIYRRFERELEERGVTLRAGVADVDGREK